MKTDPAMRIALIRQWCRARWSSLVNVTDAFILLAAVYTGIKAGWQWGLLAAIWYVAGRGIALVERHYDGEDERDAVWQSGYQAGLEDGADAMWDEARNLEERS